MSSQNLSLLSSDVVVSSNEDAITSKTSNNPPVNNGKFAKIRSPFWHNRFVEAGLILSIALYYIVGNVHLGSGRLFQLNPLYSLPFLLIFAALCWYRLPIAVALLPLALPYYLLQKTVVSHYSFSLAEIALGVCLVVALRQLVIRQNRWKYWLSWRELRDRFGPCSIPIFVFFAAAVFSIVIAFDRHIALRDFREEVLDPLLYLLLALYCLRSRQDVTRLLGALLGAGVLVALLGLAQYFLFKNTLVVEAGVRRVHAVYGSANSIGLLLDYVLPVGLALVAVNIQKLFVGLAAWRPLILSIALCLPLLLVLYLSQSLGAWVAIAVATLFITALSIRNRKVLFISGLVSIAVLGVILVVFHMPIADFVSGHHTSVHGVSTLTKRLYLWQSALNMIHDSPWFGYGMGNWLCHYSKNAICDAHMWHYWIVKDPVTGVATGLRDEPTLSHPHNIILHIWVSMGIFGVLAFLVVLALFFWLFARILIHLRPTQSKGNSTLQWMTLGIGAAMLAAIVQGQVDSAFLEQDLAFCFWILITAMLLLRVLSGTPWRGRTL